MYFILYSEYSGELNVLMAFECIEGGGSTPQETINPFQIYLEVLEILESFSSIGKISSVSDSDRVFLPFPRPFPLPFLFMCERYAHYSIYCVISFYRLRLIYYISFHSSQAGFGYQRFVFFCFFSFISATSPKESYLPVKVSFVPVQITPH